jgi:signal transduction histidine kinase/ligand-binding sensor domain-containing protein
MLLRIAAGFCMALVASGFLRAAPVAEPVDMLFRQWSTRDGLPNNRVREVIRTRDGFIWLATDGGAVRFDGMNFSVFGLREGLLAPIVLAIRETADGTLWLGTLGGGLSVFRNGGIENTYTIADGLPSNWIIGIEEDETGRLIAVTRGGSARFDRNRFVPLPKAEKPSLPIRQVKRDGDGTLWGISPHGSLCTWRDGSWREEEASGPANTEAILVDPQGRLWAGGGGLLRLRENGVWQSHPLPPSFRGNVSGMAASADGVVWLAFHRYGLCGFKDGRFITPKPTSRFTQDQVETVYSTSDGQLWVTSANGFYRMSGTRIRSYLLDDHESPSAANILGGMVEMADGEYIIATQGSGFYRWAGGRTTRLSDDPGLGISGYGNAVIRSADGTVWLGAKNGLYEMKQDGSIRRQPLPGYPGDEIWSLAEDSQGLWVGTGSGKLHLLRGGEAETIAYGGDVAPVKAFASQADGTLWVGTRGDGLFRREHGSWRRFDRNTGLLSDIIRVLYLDPEGHLWVGSDGGGLSLWRKDEGFVSITSAEGLPSNTVSQIVQDSLGRLWVGTHRGFAVFDRDSLAEIHAGRVRNLRPFLVNEADGMPANELTIVPPLLAADGTTMFATTRGFFRLRMEDFQPKPTRPGVFMEGIRANGRAIPFNPRLVVLPPGSSRLEFAFTGLDFHDPGRVKFRRRMIGVEDDWVSIGSRRVSEFSNLPPGRYQFQVEASSGSGLWSAKPAVVDILITPHFWETRWFQAGCILAGLAMVAAPVWLFERSRARRKIEVMKRRQAVDSERARIARDLHDDIGASLTQIALQSQLAERNVTREPERAASHLREVFTTASRMTRTLDEIIWAVNPVHDTLENFILFLGSHTQDVAETAGLRCRFDLPESIPPAILPSDIRHDLYLAAKEVLHNIVKHADASEVLLRVRLDEREMVIVIGDDGKGLGESAAGMGADGLGNMRARLGRIRGTCICRSEPGKGTTVEMRVPMGWGGKTTPCHPGESLQNQAQHE